MDPCEADTLDIRRQTYVESQTDERRLPGGRRGDECECPADKKTGR